MASYKVKNRIYAAGLVVVTGIFAGVPLWMKHRQDGANLTTQAKPLLGSQTMRGAYANTGSKDVGADPAWQNGRYVGGGDHFAPSAEDVARARAAFEANLRQAAAAARGGETNGSS